MAGLTAMGRIVRVVNPLRILFVCTGNRYRSPLATAMVRERAAGEHLDVQSAGTLELPPSPALPEAMAAAEALGLSLADHRSRPLRAVDPAKFDLLLAFERDHLATAVVGHAFEYDRAFTLPEFIRLARDADIGIGGGPAERIAAIASIRARDPRAAGLVEEVEDPLGKPREVFDHVADEIGLLTQELVEILFARAGDSARA